LGGGIRSRKGKKKIRAWEKTAKILAELLKTGGDKMTQCPAEPCKKHKVGGRCALLDVTGEIMRTGGNQREGDSQQGGRKGGITARETSSRSSLGYALKKIKLR